MAAASIALSLSLGPVSPVCQHSGLVPTLIIDPAAVRRRFSALGRELAFFDAPGGTQVPDEVIDAISGYLGESNANLGGPFETSRRSDLLVGEARRAAAASSAAAPRRSSSART